MEASGLLGPLVTIAHGVWPLPDEIDLIARSGTNVVLNMLSNLRLKNGVAPILDYRALEALGVKSRSTYPLSFWLAYLAACRRLAKQHGVSVRTLDKALWQWSKERASAPT